MTEVRRRAIDTKDRVPLGGQRTNLQLSAKDSSHFEKIGRVPRWMNDHNGRIEAAEAGSWVFVDPVDVPSMGRAGLHAENSDLNSKVSKVVTRSGEPMRAYLMSIDKDLWDSDQELKEDRNRLVDEMLEAATEGGQSIEGGYTPK